MYMYVEARSDVHVCRGSVWSKLAGYRYRYAGLRRYYRYRRACKVGRQLALTRRRRGGRRRPRAWGAPGGPGAVGVASGLLAAGCAV